MVILNVVVPVLVIILSYLIGSIPSGIIIGKIFFHQDPRKLGSGNTGGTNATRLWGFKFGFLVYLFDFLKLLICLYGFWALLTFVPLYQGHTIMPTFHDFLSNNINDFVIKYPVYWLSVPFCALGHCFPLYVNFQGGKAASVTFSSLIFTSWFTAPIAIGSFALTLKLKKYVSLASIVGSIFTSCCAFLTMIPQLGSIAMFGPTLAPGWMFGACTLLTSLLLLFRHIPNIKRIKKGEERKISWMK